MTTLLAPPVTAGRTLTSDRVRSIIYLIGFSAVAAYFLVWPIWRIHFLVEIWPTESWNAYYQDAAAAGLPLYPPADSLIGNNYPPLSFLVIGKLGLLFGDTLYLGRWLSIAGLVLVAAEIALAVRILTGQLVAGVLGALWYVAIMAHNSVTYIGTNDPQLFGHAIMGAALVWFLSRDRSGGSALPPLLLMVFAGFWKHNMIGIPVTAVAWLLMRDGRRAVGPVLLSGLAAAAGLALCAARFGPDFIPNLLATRQYGWQNVETNIGHLQWSAAAFVIWAAWALSDRHSRAASFTALHVLVGLAACLLQWSGHGVGGNAEFDFLIALGIGIGVTFAGLGKTWLARRTSLAFARDAMIVILLVRLIAGDRQESALVLLSDHFRSSIHAVERNIRHEATQVAAMPGDVGCTTKLVCRIAGKRFVVDEFKMEELLRTGKATKAGIAAMLAERGITPLLNSSRSVINSDRSILHWIAHPR